MSTAGARYFSLMPPETAARYLMACLPAIRGARNLTGHVFRSGDGERGSWDRGKVRCRRVSPVNPRPGEGPLTEPIAGVQPARPELVFMPDSVEQVGFE